MKLGTKTVKRVSYKKNRNLERWWEGRRGSKFRWGAKLLSGNEGGKSKKLGTGWGVRSRKRMSPLEVANSRGLSK